MVNLAAIRENVARVAQVAREHAAAESARGCDRAQAEEDYSADGAAPQVIAIVKANGYGHGNLRVGQAAVAGGASMLGVAQLAEAVELAEQWQAAGLEPTPIFSWIFTPVPDSNERYPLVERALELGIEISVGTPASLAIVVAAGRACGVRAPRLHLEIDTGMARGGIGCDALPVMAECIKAHVDAGLLTLAGTWTHFARAAEPGCAEAEDLMDRQLAEFERALAILRAAGVDPGLRHAANSGAIFYHPRAMYDAVRPGIALYGLAPAPQVHSAAELGLRPAMRLEGDVFITRHAPAGTGVVYGHTEHVKEDTQLATIAIGYSDGLPVAASSCGPVAIGELRTRVCGRVCMDQIVVDTHDGAIAPGDVAVIFGDPARGEPSVEGWAECAGTINYELVTAVGSRVPRIYIDEPAEDAGGSAASGGVAGSGGAASGGAASGGVAGSGVVQKNEAIRLRATDAEQMRLIGEALGAIARAGDLIMLSGPLGAGKTTLTQGLARALDVRGRVTSPTYIISRIHRARTGGPDLIHVDAYRVEAGEEIETIDLDSTAQDAVTVVEWGEGKLENISPSRIDVRIERPRGASGGTDPDELIDDAPRIVTITGLGALGRVLPTEDVEVIS